MGYDRGNGGWVLATKLALMTALAAVVVAACGGFATWAGTGEPYSEGYRDGRVYKLSHKGWVNRSWEGQMALPGVVLSRHGASEANQTVHGQSGNVWEFSIDDGQVQVIEDLKAVRGDELVRLHYHEWVFYRPWRNATGYRVTRVERLDR
jgi:hypothetical protein